ncbi:MAG: hypothetical protein NTY07_06960 [Bacteroidia bacterium]|nr:hypothetical protein [Bacteroidia bacterium]
MKNLILSMFIILIFVLNAFPQSGDQTITRKKKIYYQNDKVLTRSQLKTVLANNPASLAAYQKFKTNNRLVNPFLIAGSAVAIAGGIVNLTLHIKQVDDYSNMNLHGNYTWGVPVILAGLAADLVGIAFLIPAKKHLKKSITDYNSSIKTVGYEPVQFNLMVNSNGLGVRMRF